MARRRRMQPRFFLFLAVLVGIGVGVFVLVKTLISPSEKANAMLTPSPSMQPQENIVHTTPKPEMEGDYTVSPDDSALPSRLGFETKLMVNRNETDTFERSVPICFGHYSTYSDVDGLLTFGGNHYRNTFAFGKASVSDKRLFRTWEERIGQIDSWSGTGWTGQPLIIRWPSEVRSILGVSDTYKSKEGFTEVIYPTMDGNIYFYDLETGAKTRTINAGVVMKGTACLDPNGYPLLYVGQSIAEQNENGLPIAYLRVYSLITNEEIYRFGKHDYFSPREWQAYDASPLIVDDTIIFTGENGVLYSSKLNTVFDAANASVSIDPEPLVKYRYTATGYSKDDSPNKRWYGIESSVSAFRNYLFFTDNGGRLQCVDVNTYRLLYAVDVGDDADASVVVDESYDDNTVYLYTAGQVSIPSGDLGEDYGYSYHKKIDGLTGRIVWENRWVASIGDENSNGGTNATPHAGRGNISHLVIYAMNLADVSDVDSEGERVLGGKIIAYNKQNGEVAWSLETQGSGDYWSSPVVVYDENDRAYLIQCDRSGYVKLYDAATSALLYSLDLGSRIDSTPAVFNNYMIVGTRGKGGSGESAKIICVKIT